MKFEFPRLTKAKLASINVRSEKHGADLVPAVDLKIVVDCSNDILDKFHAELKEALYFKAHEEDLQQGELDGIKPVTDLPNLRFPKLDGLLKWDYSGCGYRLDIDYGLGGASNLEMFGCGINNIGIACKEGGTVEVSFRCQISDVTESTIGKLATLCQHEVQIILTPPTVVDVAQALESMESPLFSNQDELDAMDDDDDDVPQNPFIEPVPKNKRGRKPAKTPEEALAESVVEE